MFKFLLLSLLLLLLLLLLVMHVPANENLILVWSELKTDAHRKFFSANMHAGNWRKRNLPQSKFHFPRIFIKFSSGLKLNEVMSHVVWFL